MGKRLICIRCGETEINEFNASCIKRSVYICKSCAVKDSIEWQQRNPRKYRANKQTYKKEHPEDYRDTKIGWYLKRRVEILSAYSNGLMKCAHCGFDDLRALSIDHIGGGGFRHRNLVGDIYGWLKRNNFPKGYQVLCMNCQLIKRQVNGECYMK